MNKHTRFTDLIRIDPKQKVWIRLNKGKYKTLAGKLDEIINRYKDAHPIIHSSKESREMV